MAPKTPLLLAFAASLSFHALAAASLGGGIPWSLGRSEAAGDVITIDYVEAPPPPAAVRPAPPKEIVYPRNKKTLVPAVSRKSAPAVKKAAAAKPGSEVVARRKGIKPYYPPELPAPKKAADFLADPVKGRVLANYFSLVKRRIDETVRKRYSEAELGRGTVSLAFALNADGTLAFVAVTEPQTKASAEVRDLAVQCVRETAPFVAFPAELDVPRIAFNVTVLFDEL